jgi:hypothetical protein
MTIASVAAVRKWLTCVASATIALTVTAPSNRAVTAAEPVRCGIDMRNVRLHVAESIVLDVRTLDGELDGHTPGVPPIFDDPTSYTMRLKSAEMSIDGPNLTALMGLVFTGSSPVKRVKITIEEGLIKQSGTLHKGVDVPFSMKTSVSATPDGRLRLHATSLKAGGIPVKGMLDLFGVELDNLMKMPGQSGLQVEGDDILISPTAILPPPATEGRVSAVRVTGDRLVMTMTGSANPPGRPPTLPDPAARNYLYFHGGIVRFGKLTMTDADLQLIDADPADPFDFFPAHYADQLVAGYSRSTPRGGLKVLMPDNNDLRTPKGRLSPPGFNKR